MMSTHCSKESSLDDFVYFCTLNYLDNTMTGNMYSSSDYAVSAFRSKNLFNQTIGCNESNPSEKLLDSLAELYKVLWMAEYYMWEEIGRIRLLPLKSFKTLLYGSSLSFKVYIKKDYDNSDIWIIETNAPSFGVASLIDLLAKRITEMSLLYARIHGSSVADFFWAKRAGTLNRYMPLFHPSLCGDWIAVEIDDESFFVSNRASIERELLSPSYTLRFYGNNGCSIGGDLPWAIKATCSYDSNHNIIVDSNRVLAFVVSLEKNILRVVHRYKKNASGGLVAREANNLLIVDYRRVSYLKQLIE